MSLIVSVGRGLAREYLVLSDREVASRHVPAGFAGSWLPLQSESLVVPALLDAVLILTLESECEVRCLDVTGLCLSRLLRHIISCLRCCFKGLRRVVRVLLALEWITRTSSRCISDALLRRAGVSSGARPST